MYNHKFPQGNYGLVTPKLPLLSFSSRRHLMRFFLAFDLAANKRKAEIVTVQLRQPFALSIS